MGPCVCCAICREESGSGELDLLLAAREENKMNEIHTNNTDLTKKDDSFHYEGNT